MANPNHPQSNPLFPNPSLSPSPSTSDLITSLSTASLINNANPWRPAANTPAKRLHRHFKDFCALENQARLDRGEGRMCDIRQRDRAFAKLLRLWEGTEERKWRIWVDGVAGSWESQGCSSIEDGDVATGEMDGVDGGVERAMLAEEFGRGGTGLDGEDMRWYGLYDGQIEMEEERDGGEGLEMMVRAGTGKSKEERKDSKDVDTSGCEELGRMVYKGQVVGGGMRGVEYVEDVAEKHGWPDFVEELAVSVDYRADEEK